MFFATRRPCIAVSQEMLLEMEAVQPGMTARTMILPNGVDIPGESPVPDNPAATSKNLLFVGRIDRIKGIFVLVEAMKSTHPDIHLTMVGSGPYQAELERRILAAGLRDRITLTGALPQKQVFEKIQASFALVAPSFHETQGIVLLEANACGKPVIASDIPGIREVVLHGQTGWMIPAGDAAHLTDAINHFYKNPIEAAAMGEAGRLHVQEKFAWEKIALETERIYGEVMAQKSRRVVQDHLFSILA